MPILTIPAILTSGDWSKHKGLIAKIKVPETGIGAAMNSVQAAYKAVDWRKFDPKTACNPLLSTEEQVLKAMGSAETELTKVEKVQVELRKLETAAKKAEGVFKADKHVPHSVTEHAGKIAAAADNLFKAFQTVDMEVKVAFLETKDQAHQVQEGIRKVVRDALEKLPPEIQKLRSAPDLDKFQHFRTGPVRALGAALNKTPKTASLVPAWAKLGADSYQPAKVEEIAPKLTEIEREVGKARAMIG